jgi:Flp pilus assembly protein TadG
LRRRDDAAAAVEFAMTLPLLVLLFIGLVEIGLLLRSFHVVDKSVQDAARYLARTQSPFSDATVQGVAINLAMRGSPSATAPLLIPSWTDPTTVSITQKPFTNDGSTTGGIILTPNSGVTTLDAVVVSAQVPIGTALLGVIGLPTTVTFRISHEERHIGE